MRKNFYEIFEEVEKAPDTLSKVNVLRQNQSPALITFFRNIYSPNVKYCVKEIPKYKNLHHPIGMGETSIDMELRTSYLFEESHPKKPPNMSEVRLNQILIQILECLETKEAKIYSDMLFKKIDYPSISKALVQAAFPTEQIS
jgi:hypothetical protein